MGQDGVVGLAGQRQQQLHAGGGTADLEPGNLPVRACRSRSRRRRYACRAQKAHSNTRAQNAPIWDSLHRDELEPATAHNGGSARSYLAVGGACQQSRYGLLDGRLFCIFIHHHPWGECPHLPHTALSSVVVRRAAAKVLPQRNLEQRPAEVPWLASCAGPGAAASLGAGLGCGPPVNRWHGWFIRP